MRALQFAEPGVVDLAELPTPQPSRSDEVAITVQAVGICGSDLHGVSDGLYPHPTVLGHEFCGVTPDGRRVAVNPQVPCRECASCAAGAPNLCLQNSIIGITRDGAVSETVIVPADRLVEMPEHATWTAGAMAEVVANAVHALSRGGGAAGKRVGIAGAGPIGLATLVCARDAGAAEVVVCDLVPARLAVAASLGAEATGDSLPAGHFDLVVDAVGARATRSASLAALRPGGTAVWIGVNDLTAEISATVDIVVGERSIVGSFAYTDAEFAAAVEIAANQDFAWVDTFPLADAPTVFADLQAGRSTAVKAHFTP